jgi:transcriptional regulator
VTKTPQDLLSGSLDTLILQSLRAGRSHGYAVSRWVRERTEGVLSIEDAALYKALHRMEDRGWIESQWGRTDQGRRAKYYEITDAGRQALEEEKGAWLTFAAAVHRVLGTG